MKKEPRTSAVKRIRKSQLIDPIIAFLEKNKTQAYNYKQISYGIGALHPSNKLDIINILDDLAADDRIVEVSLGRYKAQTDRGSESTGIFVRRSNGKNGVIINDETIPVPERDSMHALNGDKVQVMISAHRRGQEAEARVVKILERKDQVFIGTLKVEKGYSALVTDSRFLAADIRIPRGKLKGGKDGDKAIARITKWPDNEMTPTGEVVDILGRKGEVGKRS